MGKGPQLSPVVVGVAIAIAVVAVIVVGWKIVAPPGKADMPPDVKARREKALGLPAAGGKADSSHSSKHS